MFEATQYLEGYIISRSINLVAINRDMGAGQSTSATASILGPGAVPDNDKNKLFITIFERLLKETDIVDIKALTKGPGSCGAYVVLLENRLNSEFQKIQLETATTGAREVQPFLYTKAKDITTESAADKNACHELAIFYIRLLQLVAALTMSIFTPPDLIERVRQNVINKTMKKQQKNIPISLEEKEDLRVKRWNWLRTNILGSATQSGDTYFVKDKPMFKYNNTSKTLTYTSNDKQQYEAKMAVEEMGAFPLEFSLIKVDTYWITLANPKDNTIIFRMLVNKDGSGYRFGNEPNRTKEEEKPIVYYKDWATDLAQDMISSLQGVKIPEPVAPVQINPYGFAGNMYRQGMFGGKRGSSSSKRKTKKRVFGGSGASNTPNAAAAAAAATTRKNTKSESTLPKKFQEIHQSIINWQSKFASWTDAAPASYRSILLYSKPNMASLASASYMCVDTWSQKSLRDVPPFAALESLYFNRDDGTASYSNKEKLRNLVEDFRNLYSVKPKNSSTTFESFEDVILPPLPEKITNELCRLRTAYGDISPENKYNDILQVAQTKILEEFRTYFNDASDILKMLFDLENKNKKGELVIKFSPSFIGNTKGARAALEEIIDVARSKMGYHYYQVETIYHKAMQDVLSSMR